jgi:hypothetical protein
VTKRRGSEDVKLEIKAAISPKTWTGTGFLAIQTWCKREDRERRSYGKETYTTDGNRSLLAV